jgi:LemA protein
MAWIPLLLIIAAGLGVAVLYNNLVTGRNAWRNAFAQIDVQLTRRHDLVPNLVEVARRYLAHERDTLEAVIAARAGAVDGLRRATGNPADAAALAALGSAENGLAAALSRLLAVAEAYPDLKADATMGRLTEELSSTENRVAFARQAFNDLVMAYNNEREQFPGIVVAGLFGFRPAELLQIESVEQRAAPRINLG